jgi:ActR/RegA family two-component response regulator
VSKSEKFCVLVLDDDICLTTIVMKAVRMGLPSAEVLTARSVSEAQLLLTEFKIHFFILDVNLPDGTGIDFLREIRTKLPDARVMMMTSSPVSNYEKATKDLGLLLFQQKPVDTKEIVKLVRSHYENMGHATAMLHANGQFAVSLTCLSALDIIQLKCVSNATLVLQIASPSGIGRIYFEEGQIVHADTGESGGEAAFEEILRWKGGQIKELAAVCKPPRTITDCWQGLLLNVCQRMDETDCVESTAQIAKGPTDNLRKEPAADGASAGGVDAPPEDDFVVVATYDGEWSSAGKSKK